jgi:trehalose 6-phosphate synthase/phosphatase
MEAAKELLNEAVERVPGSRLEIKSASYAWHYREADLDVARVTLTELIPRLRQRAGDAVDFLFGQRVLEIRPQGIHKGRVVTRALRRAPAGAAILAAGDDATDEDLFLALPVGASSLHIGPGASQARFQLESPAALLMLLTQLCERLGEAPFTGVPPSVNT